jgi:hypothetical protein
MYYSQADENAFFDRLYGLSCIGPIIGMPDGLHIKLKHRPSKADLREIIALLFRYNLDMTPLAALRTERNGKWFDKPGMFWHESVFGKRNRKARK